MTSRLLVDKIEGKTSASTVQMPSGSVIQAVTSKYTQASNTATFSATSFTDSVSITFIPKFSNSLIKHTFFAKTVLNNQSYTVGQDCRWLRDSTILSGQSWTNYLNRNTNPIGDYYPPLVWHYVDEPNTTSAIVYKFQGRSYGGNGSNHGWSCFRKTHNDDTSFLDHAGQWTIEEIAQ